MASTFMYIPTYIYVRTYLHTVCGGRYFHLREALQSTLHLLHARVCDVIEQWRWIHTNSSLLNASSIVYGSTGTVQISLRLIHKIKKAVTIVQFVLNVIYSNNSSFKAHRKTCMGSGLLCPLVLPPL